jgi:hypothetical protein
LPSIWNNLKYLENLKEILENFKKFQKNPFFFLNILV